MLKRSHSLLVTDVFTVVIFMTKSLYAILFFFISVPSSGKVSVQIKILIKKD